MAWKLCLNYDFTYNKWVWWLEKCKTRTHTRSLQNVWRKHCWRALRMSWNKWRKKNIAHTHRERETEQRKGTIDNREMEKWRERKRIAACGWITCYLPNVYLLLLLTHTATYFHLHLHTLAYSHIRVAHRAIGFAFSYVRLMPCNFSMFFSSSSCTLPCSSSACYSISSTKIMVRIKTPIKSESATMWEE